MSSFLDPRFLIAAAVVGVTVGFAIWQKTKRPKSRKRNLTFLHFNDIYNVTARTKEPVGGASRFATLLRNINSRECNGRGMILFSGDALNPSSVSQTTRGSHMVPVLNQLNVHVACLGNHDLDHSLERFKELRPKFAFPWLISNVTEKPESSPENQNDNANSSHHHHLKSRPHNSSNPESESKTPEYDDNAFLLNQEFKYNAEFREMSEAPSRMFLGGCRDHVIFDWPVDDQGGKVVVGVFGIVELEWLGVTNVSLSQLDVLDPILEARNQVQLLQQKGCEIIVGVSHMRLSNDLRLAREVPGLHIVFGGHDHDKNISTSGSEGVLECHSEGPCVLIKSGTDFRDLGVVNVQLHDGKIQISARHVQCTSESETDPTIEAMIETHQGQFLAHMKKVIGVTNYDLDATFGSIRTKETNIGNLIADIMRRSVEHTDFALLNSGTLRCDDVIPRGNITLGHLNALLPLVDSLCVVELSGEQVIQALENGVSKYPDTEGCFLQVSGISFSFDPKLPPGQRVSNVRIGDDPETSKEFEINKKYRVILSEYMLLGKDGFDMLPSAKVLVDAEVGPTLPTLVRNYFVLQETFAKIDRSVRSRALLKFMQSLAPHAISPRVEGRIKCLGQEGETQK